jgi:N-acetylneuraminic acid mutarotase
VLLVKSHIHSVAEIFNFVLYSKVVKMQIIQIFVFLLSTNSVVESWSGILMDGDAGNGNTQLYVPGNPPINTPNVDFGLLHHNGQAAVMLNEKAYFTGGNAIFRPITNAMTIFDPSTNTSTSGAPLNVARRDHAATVVDDTIIICGGLNETNDVLTSCEQYNPSTQKWNMMTSLPTPSSSFVMATLNNRAYTFGGNAFDSDCSSSTSAVYIFDGENWATRSSIIGVPVNSHAGVALDSDRVLICGGWANKEGLCQYVSDCFIYWASRDSWTTAAPMAQIRCWHSMVMFEGER